MVVLGGTLLEVFPGQKLSEKFLRKVGGRGCALGVRHG